MIFMSGRELLDYVVEEELGEGSMAVVLRARDQRDGRVVALKVTRRDPDIVQAERAGAELQRRLSAADGHVPAVYDIRELDGRLVIAMEYVDGDDLARLVSRQAVDARMAARVARELCEHLVCAQRFERGIVHGDIKPRNVRIARADGSVRVLDFGIAKALSETRRQTRNAFASLAYSSPERLETAHVDVHSDLWAVACVLFEMLAGRPPYDGDDTRRVEERIRRGGLGTGLPGTCPAPLAAILRKALAPRLADRYAAPADLSADLAAFLAGRPTVAETQRAPSPYEETRRTGPAPADAEATRRTGAAAASEATARTVTPASDLSRLWGTAGPPPPAPPAAAPAPPPVRPPARRFRVPWRLLLAGVVALPLVNEVGAYRQGAELVRTLPSLGPDSADRVWAGLEAVRERSALQVGAMPSTARVKGWYVQHADATVRAFRSGQRVVREREWVAALQLLERANALAPDDRRVSAYQAYCRGQIARINAEAARERGGNARAARLFGEAETHFDRAASLRPGWADPLYGLARTYAYGLEDPNRTKQTLDRAMAAGFESQPRYYLVLGDAYRLHGERLMTDAAQYRDRPEEPGILERVRADARSALQCYQNVPNIGSTVRKVYDLLDRVQAREAELAAPPASLF
jgi:serine/threonine-protein kinase